MTPLPGVVVARFESGLHRLRDGRALDALTLTRHDRLVSQDYARAHALGMRCVGESARWHAVESEAGRYAFGALLPFTRAARVFGLEILWTLLDRGWPAGLDPMAPAFVARFAAFARAFARFLASEGLERSAIVPIHEIATLAAGGGEHAELEPFHEERGFELQCQLVRAAVAASAAIREVLPHARLLSAEPARHVVALPAHPEDADAAAVHAARRFIVSDMLAGRVWPQLGGDIALLDAVGLTFHPGSQWYYHGPRHAGPAISPETRDWRPLRDLVLEIGSRYARPVYLAGTSAEAPLHRDWLRYVGRELRAAQLAGTDVVGIAVHPAVDCPPWRCERRAFGGLWGRPDADGARPVDPALAHEVVAQREAFARIATLRDATFAGPAL
jgi:hypothetical protein